MDSPNSASQWYVLQAMSGQENHAQAGLLRRMELDRREGIDDGIEEVIIPMMEVTERKNGKTTVIKKKLYPGYLLVKCRLYTNGNVRNADTWTIIKDMNGVIGFVGGDYPVPLPEDEVNQMLGQCKTTDEKPVPKVTYKIGETVIIREGAFENMEGVIEGIDNDRQKLKLSVSLFGRSTPVEVEFWQVERPS